MTHLLVIDNYDSFTYNLAHGLAKAGATVTVLRNDAIDVPGVADMAPAGIVLSPGPGSPEVQRDVGVSLMLLEEPLAIPVLGVCLGMQAMAHATGGRVVRAADVVHGEAREVHLEPHPLFAGVPATTTVGRYHSLCVDPALPDEWQALGSGDDGILMAMAHRSRPWTGVQFHPESILSPHGPRMLANFVGMCR